MKNVQSEIGNLELEMENSQKKDKKHKELVICGRKQDNILEDIEIKTKCYI